MWIAVLGAISWVWFEHAWLTDDAYITFRSIEQLLDGNGLRFNVHERVQSFTHPLWLALLTLPRLAGVPLPAAAYLLSWLCFATALSFLWWTVRDRPERWLVAAAAALGSHVLLDFSSSGLETPLSLLLILLFAYLVLRREGVDATGGSTVPIVLVAALLLLTRWDHAPLVAPGLGWVVLRRRAEARERWFAEVVLGLSPLLLWTIAAFVYYGSPFPNTATAKLGAGVAHSELLAQGLRYLALTARWDLLWLPLLAIAGLAAVRHGKAGQMLAAGAAAHLAYVVSIGGDFMAGRFALPATAAALALLVWRASDRWLCGAAMLVALALLSPRGPFDAAASAQPAWERSATGSAGVVDQRPGSERLEDALRSGWLAPETEPLGPPRRVGILGQEGFRAHSRQILVDQFALSDPFLARLRYEPPWQIGHFRRRLPDGYLESLAAGENRIVDASLARLYDEVRFVTSGPLFDPGRLALAARLFLRGAAVASPDGRCPTLAVGLPQGHGASDRPRTALLTPEVEVVGNRLVVRGVAPLGENAGRWRVEMGVAPLPDRSRLRCRPASAHAPIEVEIELDYPSSDLAGQAAATGPVVELVLDALDPRALGR